MGEGGEGRESSTGQASGPATRRDSDRLGAALYAAMALREWGSCSRVTTGGNETMLSVGGEATKNCMLNCRIGCGRDSKQMKHGQLIGVDVF